MIALPRLKKKQLSDLDAMMKTEGWRLVTQMIEGSIEMHNASLINWDFKFDENGEVIKKSIMEYREKQIEVGILKKFLQFIRNPAKVKEAEKEESY